MTDKFSKKLYMDVKKDKVKEMIESFKKFEGMSVILQYVGFPFLASRFEIIDSKYTVIEVGSGNGAVINSLRLLFKDRKFVSVDSDESKKADYKYVSDLIKDQKELVNNCVLLLNYASPNKSRYDFDAVRDLKPCEIVCVIDGAGLAGGRMFLNFLDYCKYEHIINQDRLQQLFSKDTIDEYEKDLKSLPKYYVLNHTLRCGKDWSGQDAKYAIVHLSQKNEVKPVRAPNIIDLDFVLELPPMSMDFLLKMLLDANKSLS